MRLGMMFVSSHRGNMLTLPSVSCLVPSITLADVSVMLIQTSEHEVVVEFQLQLTPRRKFVEIRRGPRTSASHDRHFGYLTNQPPLTKRNSVLEIN